MKVEVVDKPVKRELRFPLIARCEDGGQFVLFINKTSGTALTQPITSCWEVGCYSNSWISVDDEEMWTIVEDLTLRFTL